MAKKKENPRNTTEVKSITWDPDDTNPDEKKKKFVVERERTVEGKETIEELEALLARRQVERDVAQDNYDDIEAYLVKVKTALGIVTPE